MSKKAPQKVWAAAPKRSKVEEFTVIGEHAGNYVALDARERPVLLPVLATFPTKAKAMVGQKEARNGWVAHFGGWGAPMPVLERCKFNPNRDPSDRYAPNLLYWEDMDGKQRCSRNAVFGLTKKEVLEKIADQIPYEVADARDGVDKERLNLADQESKLKKLLEMQTECRRAGFPKKGRRK